MAPLAQRQSSSAARPEGAGARRENPAGLFLAGRHGAWKGTGLVSVIVLFSLLWACLAVVEGRLGESTATSHPKDDPFFALDTENASYEEEKKFLEIKEKTGGKKLYASNGTFFNFASPAPEAMLELARINLQWAGLPTHVVDVAASRLVSDEYAILNDGGGNAGDAPRPAEEVVRVVGTGSVWNLDSMRTFCPSVKRAAIIRARGISRVFRLPSTLYQKTGWSSVLKRDFAVISNDLVSKDDPDVEKKAPVGTVLEFPPECFIRFLWRERFYQLHPMDVDVVTEDETTQKFVETGEKMHAIAAVASTDDLLKWKMGFFRFREIVEQRAHAPENPLQKFLERETQHQIKAKCLEHAEYPDGWTLRRCFFEMNRDHLFEILGQHQLNESWGRYEGLTQVWTKGLEVYPNAVYLRVCLCGAKKASLAVAKDMAAHSYLYDHSTTLKDWLVSGQGSLEIPDLIAIPEAYAMARDCSEEELMEIVRDST